MKSYLKSNRNHTFKQAFKVKCKHFGWIWLVQLEVGIAHEKKLVEMRNASFF